ncbi:MAG: sensor histidine kinase [Acetivibrionales bacterium]
MFIAITLICFIVFDYDILNVRINLLPFQHYTNFYSSQMQTYFYSFKNIMDSFNLVLFVSFFALIIQAKIRENKEYMNLNNQLKEKVEELKIANEKIEAYAQKSVEMAKIKERNRLAREIHDILGHSLTSITTGIEACLDFIDVNPSIVKKHMAKIRDIAQKGLNDARRSVKELKIDSIEKYALVPAIKQLTEELNTFSGTKIELNITGQELKIEDNAAQAVYRVIQECITNALRHGKATLVTVNLTFKYDGLTIQVKDNGLGCEVINKGFGLMHIEERIKMLCGEVKFESVKGNGFSTHLFIPLRGGV